MTKNLRITDQPQKKISAMGIDKLENSVYLSNINNLFNVQKAAISKHLKNIFADGELLESSVVSKMETTASDGAIAGKEQTKAGKTRASHVHERLGTKAQRILAIQRTRHSRGQRQGHT